MGNVNMEASQINYRGGEKKMSVEEALNTISSELDTLKSGLNSYETIASVTADGVKTFSELFSELYSYITKKCAIVYNGLIFNKTREVTGAVSFGTSTVMEGIVYIVNMTIYSNRTEYAEVEITSNGVTFADKGSAVVPSGRTVQLVK